MELASKSGFSQETAERVAELKKMYWAPEVSAAYFLCDQHDPDRLAYHVVGNDLTSDDITFGDLREGSSKVASALKSLGLGPGDRVATLMGKGRDYLCTVLGIWRLGAVHVPLFTAFATPQISFRLLGSKTGVVICDDAQAHKLVPQKDAEFPADLRIVTTGQATGDQISFDALMENQSSDFEAYKGSPDHPVVQLYTSGTTGTPKGVIMPVKSFASFHSYMEFGMDVREGDVVWSGADPGWAYGLFTAVFGGMLTGAESVLLAGGFSPETTYGTLEKFGVTNFTAAPTVYRAIKAAELPPPQNLKLRCASSAGEPLTPDVNIWAEKVLGVLVHDHYGQTEMGMMIGNHHNSALKMPLKSGSMGVSTPGFKAAVLKTESDEPAPPNETGRLAIDLHGSELAWFTGYADLPEKTAEKFTPDGRYYITGDVAEIDEDEFVHFSSRDDDIIIMAGYRIGPFEIESTLSKHPAIVESAAVARQDDVRGEVLEAFVVLSAGYDASDELTDELKTFVKKNFAAHAYPRRIHYAETLPKTPSGKIQRFLLRKQLANEVT